MKGIIETSYTFIGEARLLDMNLIHFTLNFLKSVVPRHKYITRYNLLNIFSSPLKIYQIFKVLNIVNRLSLLSLN